MTPNFFSSQLFHMGIKNAEFEADFESVEKVEEKFTEQKLQGLELLPTVLSC